MQARKSTNDVTEKVRGWRDVAVCALPESVWHVNGAVVALLVAESLLRLPPSRVERASSLSPRLC